MIRIDFHKPLTALEIRDPAIDVCEEVASEFGLYVAFDQHQQPAFDGYSGQRNRKRIGNGKHKNWYINYQKDKPHVSRPTVVGRVALKSPYDPANMQFGGFDYGKFGEIKPTYNHITVHTPGELNQYNPIDPSPEILAMTYQGLRDYFEGGSPRLFDIAQYSA